MSLNPETHRLTDLPKEKHPRKCQRCGLEGQTERMCSDDVRRWKERHERIPNPTLTIWQEHDHRDQPEMRFVVLCGKCSDECVEQHPRLYKPHTPNTPIPGCSTVCLDCRWREGVTCKCPRAKVNGGEGLKWDCEQPSVAFVDGTRGGRRVGWREAIYHTPAKGCSGHETT